MKRLLLVITGILLLHFSQAQNLAAQKDTVTSVGLPTDYEITIFNYFVNSSGTSRSCTWVRNEVSLPNGWTTTVCDADNCMSPTTNSRTVPSLIPSNSPTLLSVNFLPNNTAGTGVVKMDFYFAGDTASAWYIATADAAAGVSKVSVVKDITLYPTPAKDNLYVVYSSSVLPNRIEIYNVLGQIVKTVPVQPERNGSKLGIEVANLDKGLYFLRVYSATSATVLTKQFTKE